MPPQFREILDSEDEEELSPVKSRLDQADAHATLSSGEMVPVDVSTHTHTHTHTHAHTSSEQQGTGSTDEQLRQAHLDLMASTQDAIDVAEVSPGIVRTKRRLTGSDGLPPPSSSAAARQPKRTRTDPIVPVVASSEATVPGPTIPDTTFFGTSDTIAGATIPSMHMPERQTPARQTMKPSTQQTPSDERSVSLTPFTVSAFSSSDQRKDHSGSSGEKRSQPRSSAKKQPKHPTSDHLGSDDIAAIGMPKEQYKPRPSRSRSTQILVEPIDYSVRPEKKAKAKRNATTGSPMKPNGPSPFPERPILESPGFEALSPPPESANTDAELPTPNEAISEMAPPAPKAQPKKSTAKKAAPKAKPTQYGKQRGRPKKQPEVVISNNDDDDDDDADADADADAPEPTLKPDVKPSGQVEVQVIISPQNLTQASDSDVKTAPPTAAPQQQDLASEIVAKLKQTEPPPTPNKTAKLSKAAKSKAAKAAKSVASKDENDEPETSKSLDSAPLAAANKQKETPVEENDEEATTPQPATAKKVAVAVPVAGAKGSPSMGGSNKPQTPFSRYRVGLSKTQRIPSLLRVFKK